MSLVPNVEYYAARNAVQGRTPLCTPSSLEVGETSSKDETSSLNPMQVSESLCFVAPLPSEIAVLLFHGIIKYVREGANSIAAIQSQHTNFNLERFLHGHLH